MRPQLFMNPVVGAFVEKVQVFRTQQAKVSSHCGGIGGFNLHLRTLVYRKPPQFCLSETMCRALLPRPCYPACSPRLALSGEIFLDARPPRHCFVAPTSAFL